LTSPPKTWPPGPGGAASRAPQGRNSWSSSAPARTGNCIGPGWNTGSEASPAGTRAATGPTSNGGWRSSRRGPARYWLSTPSSRWHRTWPPSSGTWQT